MLPVVLMMHNIRSAYNVGAIFRTADACGVSHMYLSGHTPAPVDRFGRANTMISKTALGAERVVSWESILDPSSILEQKRSERVRIIGVEQSPRSIDYKNIVLTTPALIIVGNEVEGIEDAILCYCDDVIEIPMRGTKESLNVSVATGIVLARLMNL